MDKEIIGSATLYMGDCLDVLPTLTGVDAVVTDPPYSSGGFNEAGKSSGSIGTRGSETIANDNLSTRGYLRLMRQVFQAVPSADEAYVFTDWRMWINAFDAVEDGGFRVRNMLVWDKGHAGMGRPWRGQHELICYGKKTPAKDFGRSYGNVLKAARTGNKEHPTEKPVELMQRILENTFGQVICDPFMGSGTTGVAAVRIGKPFIGVEVDRKHFETACRRIDDAQRQARLIA